MKRVIALTLALAMALALLSACGGPDAQATLLVLPTEPAGAAQPTAMPAPTHHPEETHHVEESAHPEETHHAEPTHTPESTHHVTATPAPASTPAPAPTLAPAAEVDLMAFLVSIAEGDEEFGANMEVAGDFLENYYPGLSAISTRQRVIYQPRMTSVVCEIALVEVSSSADVDAVKNIFQQRIDYQVGTDDAPGGAWYPASIEGWRSNSRVVSQGNFVMMIAYAKCDSIVSAFNALF